MLILIDKIIEKIKRIYRTTLFRKYTKCKSKGLKIRGKVLLMNKNVTIGDNCTLYPGVMFFGDGKIVIGDKVQIGNGVCIYSSKEGGVFIGNNVMIGAYSYIIDADHGIKKGDLMINQPLSVKKVTIDSDVWISQNVTILKGSTIEEGSVIGAKSLVKGYIDSNGVAVGIPAKVIKHRV